MKIEKRHITIIKTVSVSLLCFFTLCAQECDTSWLGEAAGALVSTGLTLIGVDSKKAQELGLALAAGGAILEIFRPKDVNYNPGNMQKYIDMGLQGQQSVVDNKNKKNTQQERIDEMRAENERQREEIRRRFEDYNTPVSTGNSSVTGTTGSQNVGNPQYNNIAAKNNTVVSVNPGNRSRGTGSQRVGGNVTSRPEQTGRYDQSVNPNASDNFESRQDGAQGSQDYNNQQQAPDRSQKSISSPQTLSGAKVVRSGVTQTQPQQPPKIADTIANWTPPPRITPTPPSETTSVPAIKSPRPIPTPPPKQVSKITKGYDFSNQSARISCETLSVTGKQILFALDEIGKELNRTIIITDGDRPWEDQLSIVLKRIDSYLGSKDAFITEYGKEPPKTISELTDAQKEWFKNRIVSQAGRPNAQDRTLGFSHVGKDGKGGNAVDIWVKNIPLEDKIKLREMLLDKDIGVLMEIGARYDSPNNPIQINDAEVFHLSN